MRLPRPVQYKGEAALALNCKAALLSHAGISFETKDVVLFYPDHWILAMTGSEDAKGVMDAFF
jgi:hypothetical protein